MRRAVLLVGALVVVAIVVAVARGSSRPQTHTYLVRAIFDDASFAARGEDVRIAGANVGSIQALGVTSDKRAAVTIAISDNRFAPFHADATCAIRPQSLIGEEYVDCTPGSSGAARLSRISSGPGRGAYLLPVARTSSPVDSDIVQDISSEPVRQSLAVIIDEFGTGLAARGSDLNAVIHRANPALGDTDKVLKILAGQNHVLARLATDSDTVLAPLAKERKQISGFVTQANTTAVASAARAQAISQTFNKFPSYLQQLRPLMADLGTLADQGTPLLTSAGQSAAALGQQFANLTPFAAKARTALINLGAAAHTSQPALLASLPLAQRLKSAGTAGAPTAANLQKLTTSLDDTGGIEQLMTLLFNGAVAANGFDSLGHYVRDEPLVSSCTNYVITPTPGCSANFAQAATAATAASAAKAGSASAIKAAEAAAASGAAASSGAAGGPGGSFDRIVARAVKSASSSAPPAATMKGLLSFLIGNGQ
jgi:phospholipid/cholesterol/gamma-HCH transport system substrate-binding protein